MSGPSDTSSQSNFGIFLGRLNPIHLGHEQNIKSMIDECGEDNCLILIGSSNAPVSLRYFFSYGQRRHFVRALFPNVALVGIPDFRDDGDWLLALDDILSLTGKDPSSVCFYAGSEKDVDFLIADNRKVKILDRFDGTTPTISATQVRDALIQSQPLGGLVNDKIADEMREQFAHRWEHFKHL